jgi:hypothetical protein
MIVNLKPYSVTAIRLLWYNQELICSQVKDSMGREKMTM